MPLENPITAVTEETPRTYLGQQVISGNDGSQDATLPDGTTMIYVRAEGGPVYCSINAAAAAATSGYYIPENSVQLIGPYSNITSLGVFAATGDKAHLVYES